MKITTLKSDWKHKNKKQHKDTRQYLRMYGVDERQGGLSNKIIAEYNKIHGITKKVKTKKHRELPRSTKPLSTKVVVEKLNKSIKGDKTGNTTHRIKL